MEDIRAALSAKRETRLVEFKGEFNVDSQGDWCELIKDLIAISNQGGGMVLIGVGNDGKPTGFDVTAVLVLDPAKITDKVSPYIGGQQFEWEVSAAKKGGHQVAILKVPPAEYPLVFTRPGTYPIAENKQKTAFSVGTVYFRHGAKSAPGSTEDLRKHLERRLKLVRNDWMKGVRKIIRAPAGSRVQVLPPEVRASDSRGATPFRITADPRARLVGLADPDSTHPFRQVDVIREIKSQVPDLHLTAYDMLCVRRAHTVEQDKRMVYKSKFSSPRYSQAFVDWVLKSYGADKEFFETAKDLCALL